MAASPHFTYLDYIIPQVAADGSVIKFATQIQQSITAVIVAAAFILVGRFVVSRRLKLAHLGASFNSEEPNSPLQQALIPEKKITLFGLLDFLMECFVNYFDSVAGPENRKHAPFVASVFFFIFFLNLLGLIPGMPAATTTVWVNVAIAVVVFLHFNIHGIREHGFVNYMKHFMGPVWWMVPVLFCIEISSILMRVLTLNLRLYWNIVADHKVLEIFSNFLSGFIPGLGFISAAPFYFIGVFVSFMQAFVFATLTMIYIVLATQHDEEGH